MIRARIQIGKGEIYDAYDKYGFVYLDADERTAPDIQDYTTTKYVEDSVEFIDTRTIEVAFDYKVKFLVEAPNGNFKSVNNKIDDFNKLLFVRGQGGMLYAQKVTLYNDLNRVKIVGYPKPVSEPTEVYHTGSYGGSYWIAFELTIHVSNPKECVWATERNTDGMPEVLYNATDAESGAVALTTQTLPIVLPDGTTLGKIYSHSILRHITIPLRRGDSVSGTTQAYGNAPYWVRKDETGKVTDYQAAENDTPQYWSYTSDVAEGKMEFMIFNLREGTNSNVVFKRAK